MMKSMAGGLGLMAAGVTLGNNGGAHCYLQNIIYGVQISPQHLMSPKFPVQLTIKNNTPFLPLFNISKLYDFQN